MKVIAQRENNAWKPQRTYVFESVRESLAHDCKHHRLGLIDVLWTGRFDEWRLKGNSKSKNILQRIIDAIIEYFEARPVQERISKLAKHLVRICLRRAKTMQSERFATGVVYRCPVSKCPETSSRFEDRSYLLDHPRDIHDKLPPDIIVYREILALLDNERTNSR